MTDLFPILVLLLAATILVVVSAHLRLPYTVLLVILGVVLGWVSLHVEIPALTSSAAGLFTPEFFFGLLLPPVVFEAGIHVDVRLLRRRAPLILFLVLVGVLFTTLFTGVVVSLVVGLPIGVAVLLAAILSPTDPIAVVDLFRRVRVPEELATIVESESLLNDGIGVVLFLVVLAFLQTGHLTLVSAIGEFLWLSGGGVLVGVAVAAAAYLLHRQLEDPAAETALTVVVAYGTYLLATLLGTSGIVATAVAGIGIGAWVIPRAMNDSVRQAVVSFWKVVVYIVNSLVFLSMGLLLNVTGLFRTLGLTLLVFGLLLAGRSLFVYAHRPLARAFRGRDGPLPDRWYPVITLAGVRGVIPVVLALSLLGTSLPVASGTTAEVVATVLGVAILSVVANNFAEMWYIHRWRRSSAASFSDRG